MSNRKYPRLPDGYHDRSQYHPYQTTGKYSKGHPNCIADGRSPNESGSGSRGNSPYNSSRHSNSSPRSHRPKSSYSRSRESGKRGSSKSPSDSHGHHVTNSHGNDRHGKPNHVTNDEIPHWSQHNSSSGKVYYYNSKTEKSQWEKPKEWIERERREKERREKDKREVAGIKDGRETNKDTNSHSRESSYSKSNDSMSKTNNPDIREKRDGVPQHISRSVFDEQRRDVLSYSGINSDGRRHQVVKTCSAYTTAVSTVVHRSTPMEATPMGDTYTSPVGSVQDVSPPSTPSSRASIMETISHSPSPKLVSLALSPHFAQLPASAHSPQLNFSQQQHQQQQQSPYVARHVFPQTSVSVPPGLQAQHRFVSQQQYGFPQQAQAQLNNYRHYTQMNVLMLQQNIPSVSAPVSVVPTTQQLLQVYDAPVISQPALHPLQQATLLQQRQLAGAQHQTVANLHQPFQSAHATNQSSSPQIAMAGHVDDRTQSSPDSPEQCLVTSSPVVHATIHISSGASHSQPSSAVSSPLTIQKSLAPSVNLHSLAKYVDKGLTEHVTAWQTDVLERQLQKLSEESMSSTNESDRFKTGQIQFLSQLGFMELRVETGSKRLAALKELTKTLGTLLAESDAKPLNSWKS